MPRLCDKYVIFMRKCFVKNVKSFEKMVENLIFLRYHEYVVKTITSFHVLLMKGKIKYEICSYGKSW